MNDMTPSARFEKLLLDNERKAIFKFTASGQSHRPTFTATAEIDGEQMDCMHASNHKTLLVNRNNGNQCSSD